MPLTGRLAEGTDFSFLMVSSKEGRLLLPDLGSKYAKTHKSIF